MRAARSRRLSGDGVITEFRHVSLSQLMRLAKLSFHHRDPFDRLLIAQAMEERLAVVSADASFDGYGVARVW
jgi:PIN domain nuclease of toxin-antitoxin system